MLQELKEILVCKALLESKAPQATLALQGPKEISANARLELLESREIPV